jgi:hypothetical protein
MILVGVIALNLTVIRSAHGLLLPWESPALLPFISLQFAALIALRHTGRTRAFWTGYLLGGLPLTASFLLGMFSPGAYGIDQDGNHIAIPGSTSFELWHSYTESSLDFLQPRLRGIHPLLVESLDASQLLGLLLWVLPQFLASFLGGILALQLLRLRRPPANLDSSLSPSPA